MFGSSRSGAAQERSISSVPWGTWGDEPGGGNTAAGVRVTNLSAMQTLTVYGCARFIADGIATLPTDVFRDGPNGRSDVRKPAWLVEPTPGLSFIDWCTQIIVSLLIDGNALARKVYSGGQLVELDPLDPDTVTVNRVRGRRTYFVNGRELDANEVFWVPGIMFPGALMGTSPVDAARQVVGRNVAVQDFAARFFSQGANLSGVIEDPGPLDPAKARETARIWARLHSGSKKAHLPGVLQGGAVWKPTGVSNEQSQFLQTHQFTQAEIAAFMFQIDPTEFGVSAPSGSSLTYANLEQRNQRRVQVTYLPWLVRLEQAITALLPRPQYFKFNVNGLLRGEAKTRFEMYEIASRINTAAQAQGMPPFLSTEEMRDFEDWQPTTAEFAAPPAPAVPEPEVEEDEETAAVTPSALPPRIDVVRDADGRVMSMLVTENGGARRLDIVRDKQGFMNGAEEVAASGVA